MQEIFDLDGTRPDAHGEKRPVERVPGSYLRIGQKWKAAPDIRSPERYAPGVQLIRKIPLDHPIVIGRVPLYGGIRGCEGRPEEDQIHQHQCQDPKTVRVLELRGNEDWGLGVLLAFALLGHADRFTEPAQLSGRGMPSPQ